jgi:hypothetical protein
MIDCAAMGFAGALVPLKRRFRRPLNLELEQMGFGHAERALSTRAFPTITTQ